MGSPIPLIGGDYQARNLLANAQRCVNLYAEPNPEGSVSPFTYYPTPGLVSLAQGPFAPVRGLYFSSNHKGYAAIGNKLYYVSPSFTLTEIGTISNTSSRVTMLDNGQTLVVVDGTTSGWTVDLSTNAFAPISDPAFYGSTGIATLDTFMLFNHPGTDQFYTTLSASIVFDGTYFGAKNSAPDLLASIATRRTEIYLIGERTTEIWFNSGANAFPFERQPGAYIEQGTCAPYTVGKDTEYLYWLSRDDRGWLTDSAIMDNYRPKKLSTYALEYAWSDYSDVSDAFSFIYRRAGHTFRVVTFPSYDVTWVCDLDTGLWHQWAWCDAEGNFHRHRSNCYAFMYGKNVVGDWENGKLYELDLSTFTDDGHRTIRLRSFPYIRLDNNLVSHTRFLADMAVGQITGRMLDNPALVTLRWSDDMGRTWSNPRVSSFGATGQGLLTVQYRMLGAARSRIYEMSWSEDADTALNQAYLEVVSASS